MFCAFDMVKTQQMSVAKAFALNHYVQKQLRKKCAVQKM